MQTMVIFVFDKSYYNGESQNVGKGENCSFEQFCKCITFFFYFVRKQILIGVGMELICFLGRHMYSSSLCYMEVPRQQMFVWLGYHLILILIRPVAFLLLKASIHCFITSVEGCHTLSRGACVVPDASG